MRVNPPRWKIPAAAAWQHARGAVAQWVNRTWEETADGNLFYITSRNIWTTYLLLLLSCRMLLCQVVHAISHPNRINISNDSSTCYTIMGSTMYAYLQGGVWTDAWRMTIKDAEGMVD